MEETEKQLTELSWSGRFEQMSQWDLKCHTLDQTVFWKLLMNKVILIINV